MLAKETTEKERRTATFFGFTDAHQAEFPVADACGCAAGSHQGINARGILGQDRQLAHTSGPCIEA